MSHVRHAVLLRAVEVEPLLGCLKRNQSGATAVEFGLLAVPFLALILFSLQVGIVFLAEQGLQTFGEGISRNILTGTTQKQNLSPAAFKTAVCSTLPSLFSCTKLFVDVQTTTAFANANVSAPALTFDGSGNVTNSWNYNPGNPGDIVVVRLIYLWPVVGAILGAGLGNAANSQREIMVTSVFKNEKYQ